MRPFLGVLLAFIAILGLGCASTGRAKVEGNVGVIDAEGEIEWGEPIDQLPEGSEMVETQQWKGLTIQIWKDPDGRYYLCSPNTRRAYNPIVRGYPPKKSEPKSTSARPPAAQAQQGDFEADADFSYEAELDTARIQVTLPPHVRVHDPSDELLNVTVTIVTLEDGSHDVTLDGSVNGVLGALMLQGINRVSKEEESVGSVEVFFNRKWRMAGVNVNGVPAPAEADPLRAIFNEQS